MTMHYRTAGGYMPSNSSPILARKQQREELRQHHMKLHLARPTLRTWNDNYFVLHDMQKHNRKFNRAHESRKNQIRHDNAVLVEKITRTALRPVLGVLGSGSTSTSAQNAPYRHATLNYINRKKERERILKDNLSLAKRIIERKPVLDARDWQQHSLEYDHRLSNISRFVPVGKEEELYSHRSTGSEDGGEQQQQQQQQQQQKAGAFLPPMAHDSTFDKLHAANEAFLRQGKKEIVKDMQRLKPLMARSSSYVNKEEGTSNNENNDGSEEVKSN